jgi:pyruvate/2-oxoacid:ferredoxin oxidoreductase alpha subunit
MLEVKKPKLVNLDGEEISKSDEQVKQEEARMKLEKLKEYRIQRDKFLKDEIRFLKTEAEYIEILNKLNTAKITEFNLNKEIAKINQEMAEQSKQEDNGDIEPTGKEG